MVRMIPRCKIFAAADVVQHFAGIRIEQQAVDGKVAALHVEARVFGELNFIRMATVRVSAVTAEGCNFNGVVVRHAILIIATHWDKHDAELRAHSKGLWENPDDFIRRGRCGNVIVGGFAVEQQVTHTAADEIGGVSVFAQRKGDASGFNRFGRGEIHFLPQRTQREK